MSLLPTSVDCVEKGRVIGVTWGKHVHACMQTDGYSIGFDFWVANDDVSFSMIAAGRYELSFSTFPSYMNRIFFYIIATYRNP